MYFQWILIHGEICKKLVFASKVISQATLLYICIQFSQQANEGGTIPTAQMEAEAELNNLLKVNTMGRSVTSTQADWLWDYAPSHYTILSFESLLNFILFS